MLTIPLLVYVDNSTFKDNYAYDYGGAIYAKNVKINTKQDKDSEAKTYFINNHAKDNDGGAVYAEDGVTAKNALFDGNSALVYGGAIYAGSDVHIGKCIFNSNKAEGAQSQCYGGAIKSGKDVYVDNSTFIIHSSMTIALETIREVPFSVITTLLSKMQDFQEIKHVIVVEEFIVAEW